MNSRCSSHIKPSQLCLYIHLQHTLWRVSGILQSSADVIKSVQCNWSRCTVVHWAVHKYWLCHTCLLRCPPLGGCSMRYITSVSPMPTVNSKTEHHTMFKLWREVTDMCNNWPINFEGRNRNFFLAYIFTSSRKHIDSLYTNTTTHDFMLHVSYH